MRLKAHKEDLYKLRFSAMCKPAGEVANLTQLESHTTRARTMLMWRVAAGIINWGPREVELMYESTLDSISTAFDVFHYPIHEYMLDARADIWDADLAPECVRQAVARDSDQATAPPPTGETLLLAGEVAQFGDVGLLEPLSAALRAAGVAAAAWTTSTGALAYALGAQDRAKVQAEKIVAGLRSNGAKTVIADGPETAWALTRVYPALGVEPPEGVVVRLLSEVLADGLKPTRRNLGQVFVHDSRPAYLISTKEPLYTVVLPGYTRDESAFGRGPVYEAPRHLLDAWGAERVWGTWTRALAKTSGSDDGLWLTYPDLSAGLAAQRLDYARSLGAALVVTDSPLAAGYLSQYAEGHEIEVKLLAELLA